MKNFTFSEPCILIHVRDINQRDAHSSNYIVLAARHP